MLTPKHARDSHDGPSSPIERVASPPAQTAQLAAVTSSSSVKVVACSLRRVLTRAQTQPSSSIVKLNIGGVRYLTTKETLLSRGANFFTGLLTNTMPSLIDEDGYDAPDSIAKMRSC